MRMFIAFMALALVPRSGVSQGAPGTNILVEVSVTGVSMLGDTTEVTYVLTNDPSSAERLFIFTVDAPAPVQHISEPAPPQGWLATVAYGARSAARWAALGHRMLPGEVSPPLTFSAIGLPAIVTRWVRGYYPPPTDIPPDTVLVSSDPLVEHSVRDTTVGIEAFPPDRSPANLLTRLRGLLDQTCGPLAWITSSTVCTSLGGKVDAASQAVSQGDSAGAQTELQSFVAELEAQHGESLPVNDSAFWLLKVNAEYILGRL